MWVIEDACSCKLDIVSVHIFLYLFVATIAKVNLQTVYLWLYYLNRWIEDIHVNMRDYYFCHLQQTHHLCIFITA